MERATPGWLAEIRDYWCAIARVPGDQSAAAKLAAGERSGPKPEAGNPPRVESRRPIALPTPEQAPRAAL